MSQSKKISELTNLGESPANDDVLPIVDTSAGETKKVTFADFTSTLGGSFVVLTPTSGAVNDSNKTFTFSQEPSLLIINGVLYPAGVGVYNWSYAGGTVTLATAVGSGGFIRGIV